MLADYHMLCQELIILDFIDKKNSRNVQSREGKKEK